MSLSEKDKIYKYVWHCAYQRRYFAMCKKDWELYNREHETVLMCLSIANWTEFDTDKPKYFQKYQE